VPKHDPQSVTHLRNKFSPHRPFCRCNAQPVFIFVAVARRKSSSVPDVIVVIGIAPVVVLPMPDQLRLSGPAKGINSHALGVSKMLPGKNVTESDKSK
jgi:hypothetical protein